MGAAPQTRTQTQKDQPKDRSIACFDYRYTLKTGARTEYIFLVVGKSVKRLEPLWTRRSRSGAHGEDCYTSKLLERADVEVTVQISNSGRHYCDLKIKRKLGKEELLKLAAWLNRNEHICESLAKRLIEYGLPEDVLVDLIMPDP